MTFQTDQNGATIHYGIGNPNLFCAVFACLTPALFLLVWFVSDNTLPVGDGANFLGSGLKVWKIFVDQGVGSGIASLFWERGWRPILFPVFIVPFLLVTGGNVSATLALVGMAIVALTAWYAYRILRLCTSAYVAAAGAVLIGSMPVVQYHAVLLISETAFVVTALAAIYHLARSGWLVRTAHFWGAVVFLALSVAIRPAETVLVLVPPVALGVAWGMYKGCFSVGAVLVSAALLGAGVCVWMLSVFVSPEVAITVPRIATDGLTALTKAVKLFAFLLPVVAVCGAVWMVWQERRKPGEPSHRLVLGSLVFAVLMVTWWAPFARGLFEWVYENTLGPTIRNAPSVSFDSFGDQFLAYAIQGGVIILAGAMVLSLAGMVGARRGKTPEDGTVLAVIVLLLATVPLAWFTTIIGPQADPRRLVVPIVAVALSLLLIGVRPPSYRHFRAGFLVLLLVVQGAALVAAARDWIPHTPARRILSGPVPIPYLKPEPNTAILEFLNAHNTDGQIGQIAPIVFAEPADAFTINELAPYIGNGYQSVLPLIRDFQGDDSIRWFRDQSGFSHVLLGMPGGAWWSDNEAEYLEKLRARRDSLTNPYYKLDAQMALRYLERMIGDLGLDPVDTLEISGQTFVLFRVAR